MGYYGHIEYWGCCALMSFRFNVVLSNETPALDIGHFSDSFRQNCNIYPRNHLTKNSL
jgi:hypothetical protein